ncbi:hypothetical protein P154DRAFT_572022 [Amniculicola lignicola CBS 123094]|uniref:Uncharacterized protein n=1 Tax=Amniculicola lignicola CBS 123094 TaxID=1392246 RepID=A0A6A5WW42_9PLEO|nr:hypothetical protein P154DRAFT_572022 [Amniculicola lignicola CBS 123094]
MQQDMRVLANQVMAVTHHLGGKQTPTPRPAAGAAKLRPSPPPQSAALPVPLSPPLNSRT